VGLFFNFAAAQISIFPPHCAAKGTARLQAVLEMTMPGIAAFVCRLGFLLGLAALFAASAFAEPAADYTALVAAAKSGQNVDFQALREAYAQSPDYDPYGMKLPPAAREMIPAAIAGDCQKAVKIARTVIESAFIHADAHTIVALCAGKAGDDAGEQAERKIAVGLMRSILNSGDGKTPQTAYRVVTVWEEYSVLQLLKLRKTVQRLVSVDGHAYDVLDAKRDGQDSVVSVYFRIDGILAQLDRKLHPH
jgi:hypothetical protein